MLHINKNIKIFFNYFLGPLLGAWLFYSLYQQIKNQPHLDESIALIKNMPFGKDAWKFWSVIIMAFANWGLEAKKWQLMMYDLQPMKYLTAFKSVLSGVTFSLNTPNRIGEYGGRILYVNEGKRLKAISLSIAGSMCQLAITLFLGCGGLTYIIYFTHTGQSNIMGLSFFWIRTLLFCSACATVIIFIFLFKLSIIIRFIERIPAMSRFARYISVLDNFTSQLLIKLLLLSLVRYIVFVLQYLFLLQVLQVETTFTQAFWIITILFLVMAVVPSIALADLGIRGKFSTALFGLYSSNVIGILTASFGIWFINLFIPALCGSFFIMSKKFFKEKLSA